jgi:hypothetical protein
MIAKCILFLVAALALANCCSLGTGCEPPPGASIAGARAWGGLGAAPGDDTGPVEPKPRKQAPKRQIILGPLEATANGRSSMPQSQDSWEQQQAADQADEARLKRKLLICSTC